MLFSMAGPVRYSLREIQLQLSDQPRIKLKLAAADWQRAQGLTFDDSGLHGSGAFSPRLRETLLLELVPLRQRLLELSWELFEALRRAKLDDATLAWLLNVSEHGGTGGYLINGSRNATGREQSGLWQLGRGMLPTIADLQPAKGRLARELDASFDLLARAVLARLEIGRLI